jgi:Lon protease-like protein
MKADRLPSLPSVVPVLPLAYPLLLPGTVVPFTAEGEWQRALAEDALSGDGYVGVIQTVEADPGFSAEPAVFAVGCLGHMEVGRSENPDEFLVGGVVRFRVLERLEPVRGYAMARIDCSEFQADRTEIEEGLPFWALRDIIRRRVEKLQPDFDFAVVERMAGTEIATALAHALPFSPLERQALMEVRRLGELEDILLQLMAGPNPSLFEAPPLRVC